MGARRGSDVDSCADNLPALHLTALHELWFLSAALGVSAFGEFALEQINQCFVEFLLQIGFDPNHGRLRLDRGTRQDTPWMLFLRKWLRDSTAGKTPPGESGHSSEDRSSKIWEIAKLMIDYNASLGQAICVEHDHCKERTESCNYLTVKEIIRLCTPSVLWPEVDAVLRGEADH